MVTVLPPLTDILDLDEVDDGVFEAPPVEDGRPRVFGGQTMAQALAAAAFTVDGGAPCHSLHGYFLRPGKPGRPIHFEVTELLAGKRYDIRQVIGVQRDQPICQLTASFQRGPGAIPAHNLAMPEVPSPEELPDEESQRAELLEQLPKALHARFEAVWPIEIRHFDDSRWFDPAPQPATRRAWLRTREPLPDYDNLHRCALTYATDMLALSSCVLPIPHSPLDPNLQLASLDHSLWFHRPFRADEWLLYDGTCDSVADGRGLARARLFSQDGSLVASMTQEGVLHRLSEA